MTHKRNRTIEEKLEDCLDNKIENLKPELRDKLFKELQFNPLANNVAMCKKYVVKLLSIPEMGRHTRQYWISRGWSEVEAHIKYKQFCRKNTISPYSREFWTTKINPDTGKNYTDIEADYERNSRRPIRKEYWMKLGHTEEDAKQLASNQKYKNDISGTKSSVKLSNSFRRATSHRCIEYWIFKGYTEDEAKREIAKRQATFTLEKCIEKYGEEAGRQRWLERQSKWHKSYKKSNFSKISQELFWKICEALDDLNYIYFAELDEDKNEDLSGINHEMRLKLDKIVLPDFLDTLQNKVIEFDGTYWHGEVGRGNKIRNEEKDELYKKFGYSVYRVNEKDYRTNPELVVEQCLNFLAK
jgi:very-short-patch-repair endonuclease